MILTDTQAVERIKNPLNESSLNLARTQEKELRQFYSNDFPNLVLDKVQPWLLDQKFTAFKMKSANHSQDIVKSVLTHYKKVFSASGKNLKIDFGDDAKTTIEFQDKRNDLIEGVSDFKYFSTLGHRIAMIEPNSVYVTGLDDTDEIKTKRFQLKSIHDVHSTARGIEYLIIFKIKIIDGKEVKHYFVWDDVSLRIYIEGAGGKIELLEDGKPHLMTVCPAVFAYPENMKIGNFVFKRSILSDNIKDFYAFNILRTFYFVYKANSAYGREIRAKTRCDHKAGKNYCNGGIMFPNDGGESTGQECPNCSKNPSIMGEIIEIPIAQQANEDFVKNIPNLFRRENADVTVLTFHADDISNYKQEIEESLIGKGFGSASRKMALNVDQVAINYDSQEANLDEYRDGVQTVYNFVMSRSGELFSQSFERFDLFLGNKYFLKSVEQLYNELGQVIKTTSNAADIQQKQNEIVLTENRHDPDYLERHRLIQTIQPFALLGNEWLQKNRGAISARQPRAIALYDNFNQCVQIFETIHNVRIEKFGVDMEPIARVKKIAEELFRILDEIVFFHEPEPEPPTPPAPITQTPKPNSPQNRDIPPTQNTGRKPISGEKSGDENK